MTILNHRTFASFLKKPDLKAVLFYGSDEGLIDECRQKSVLSVLNDPKDPFRFVALAQSQVKDDIGVLFSQANALSLMGGRRVIVIQNVDNYFTPIVIEYLTSYTGDTLLILTSSSLKKDSSLLNVFKNDPNTGVFACYPDDAEQLKSVIIQTLDGFNLSYDALQFLVDNLGADRLISRAELEKLKTYMGEQKNIALTDVTTCIGDVCALYMDQMIDAMASGEQKQMHQMLDRLFAEGQAPIGLLRTTAGHFKRLHLVLGKISLGQNFDDAMRGSYPPMHFKRLPIFRRQTSLWNLPKIARALELLLKAEQDCKYKNSPQPLICANVFLRICAQAKI